MPIGKNAIKRVENNGYSKVETSAPDMENSEVLEQAETVVEVTTPAPAVKKSTSKKADTSKKSPAKKTAAPKSPAKKLAEKDGFKRVEVGCDMPYYLL